MTTIEDLEDALDSLHRLVAEVQEGIRIIRMGLHEVRCREEEAARGRPEADPSLTERARSAGATREWMSADGYTQLPVRMAQEMAGGPGGAPVWFLKHGGHWEAWREADLQEAIGGPGPEPGSGRNDPCRRNPGVDAPEGRQSDGSALAADAGRRPS